MTCSETQLGHGGRRRRLRSNQQAMELPKSARGDNILVTSLLPDFDNWLQLEWHHK